MFLQASSSGGKIPRMQARLVSFFSRKSFGFVLAADCLINAIIQSLFCRIDAAYLL